MLDGSEFQTAEAATLKPRDAKVVRTAFILPRWCEQEEQTTG